MDERDGICLGEAADGRRRRKRRLFRTKAELLDDATPRESLYKSASARINGLGGAKGRAAKFAIAALAAVAFAATIAFGAAQTLGKPPTEPDGPARESESAPAQAQDGADQGDVGLRQFINLDAFAFLSDESKAAFARQFVDYVAARGTPADEFVMCYSRIDQDGGLYTAWVSCPNGRQFYEIGFDVATKEFSFAPCGMPDELPEINYDAARAEDGADGPVYSDPEPEAENQGAPGAAPGEDAPRAGARWAKCTDEAALREALPEEAAAALPEAIEGFCASKGRAVSASSCSVDLAAAAPESFVVECSDGQGAFRVSAEWDGSRRQFGMSIAS